MQITEKEAYQNLAIAVIQQAVQDSKINVECYRKLWFNFKRNRKYCNGYQTEVSKKKLEYLEAKKIKAEALKFIKSKKLDELISKICNEIDVEKVKKIIHSSLKV